MIEVDRPGGRLCASISSSLSVAVVHLTLPDTWNLLPSVKLKIIGGIPVMRMGEASRMNDRIRGGSNSEEDHHSLVSERSLETKTRLEKVFADHWRDTVKDLGSLAGGHLHSIVVGVVDSQLGLLD